MLLVVLTVTRSGLTSHDDSDSVVRTGLGMVSSMDAT